MNYPKNKPDRDKKYLRWIATQPCIITGCNSLQEAVVGHHIEHAGSKCSDYRVVPLCYHHHLGSNECVHYLNVEKFEERFDINLEEIALFHKEKYFKMG